MKAVIVAGGRGERLRPLTDTVPKPMLLVKKRPILEHSMRLLMKYGIADFIFALCYRPDQITSYFGDGSRFGVRIAYTFEDEKNPMGTAGAILPAKKLLQNAFIVTYADILRELNVKQMIDYHKKNRAVATVQTYKRLGKDPKSAILFDKNGRVSRFIERPNKSQVKSSSVWTNGSFYILEGEIFDYIPENKPSDFGAHIFPSLIRDKKNVFVFQTNNYFIDIGTIKKLEEARKNFVINE